MDKALKQRLVGASVLIALAVIVLPMLLSGRPEGGTQETQKIELPPQPPELSFETRRYPIGEQDTRGQALPHSAEPEDKTGQLPVPRRTTVPPVPARAVAETESGISQTEDSAVAQSPPAAGESGNTETVAPAAEGPLEFPLVEPAGSLDSEPASGRYIVQVASFSAVENANRLSAALQESGYSVMADRVKSDAGTLHRVRVGPFASEAEASRAVLAVESKISGVKPRVVDLQPELAAQVTTPADPLVRWVVQVGSFSSVANAERLVAALRKDDMSAYQENITTSGSNIYRVRIGPFLQREEAIRTERRVREERSLNGVVMSAD
jgi:DedD protein